MRVRYSLSFVLLIVALAAFLAACGSKTRRERAVTVAAPTMDAQKVAAKAFDQVKAKTALDENSRTNAYIICVAEELIRDMHGDWEIAIFRQATPFLYVLPGRKIGVNNGILRVARNQHQLAAVMAHGLAHVVARHPDKRLAYALSEQPTMDPMRAVQRPSSPEGRTVMQALGMETERNTVTPFDASQEAEANALGMDLMARAGFNPRESITAWRSLDSNAAARSDGFLALHPSHGNRSAQLEGRLQAALRVQQEALTTRKKPDCDRLRP